jgi:Carboxypeptidase regulatory-like domain
MSLPRIALWVMACWGSLAIAQHLGVVVFRSQPVPGAVVTVSHGSQRYVTVSGDRGEYSFPELSAGIWTLRVEMTGFEVIQTDIAVPSGTPPFQIGIADVIACRRFAGAKPDRSAPAGQSGSRKRPIFHA